MPRRTIPIYSDDDYERLMVARTEVAIAERQLAEKRFGKASRSPRNGDDEPDDVAAAEALVQEKRDVCDALIDEAAASGEEWILESIGFEAWESLLEAHPPRKVTEGEGDEAKEVDHPDDADLGVNTKTFGKALLLFVDPDDSDHRTVTKAGDGDLAALDKRLRRLSRGQFEGLWGLAYSLNTGGLPDPKAAKYSLAPRSTES